MADADWKKIEIESRKAPKTEAVKKKKVIRDKTSGAVIKGVSKPKKPKSYKF